jgi:hypothetical protein
MGFQLSWADERLGRDLECVRLAVNARDIVVAPGFTPATPRESLLARLGPAQADSGRFVHYRYLHSRREPSRLPESKKGEMEEWNEWSDLNLEFQGQRLLWLEAWKSTSD